MPSEKPLYPFPKPVGSYRGFTIERNNCGFFNVPVINCWSSSSVDSAMRAIDAYEVRKAEHLKTAVREVQLILPPYQGVL
jgi:hypothetical protein